MCIKYESCRIRCATHKLKTRCIMDHVHAEVEIRKINIWMGERRMEEGGRGGEGRVEERMETAKSRVWFTTLWGRGGGGGHILKATER